MAGTIVLAGASPRSDPWQSLNRLPLPHGQGSLRETGRCSAVVVIDFRSARCRGVHAGGARVDDVLEGVQVFEIFERAVTDAERLRLDPPGPPVYDHLVDQ